MNQDVNQNKQVQIGVLEEMDFDDNELFSSQCDAAPLFSALLAQAKRLNHTHSEMCVHLGTSYSYFGQFRRGTRQLTLASEFLGKSALYLGLPRMTVLGLARLITDVDLVEKPQEVVSRLPKAFETVISDPKWQHLVNEAVRNSPFEVRYFIVRLYEEASNTQLLPKRLNPERLARELAGLNQMIEKATVR